MPSSTITQQFSPALKDASLLTFIPIIIPLTFKRLLYGFDLYYHLDTPIRLRFLHITSIAVILAGVCRLLGRQRISYRHYSLGFILAPGRMHLLTYLLTYLHPEPGFNKDEWYPIYRLGV